MTDSGVENQGEPSNPLDSSYDWQDSLPSDAGTGASAEEVVEQQLAQYAFVREERDREVRLLFRDVPSQEIARAFRAAGAYLITLMAERTRLPAPPEEETPKVRDEELRDEAETEQPALQRERRQPTWEPTGDATVRYFYSLGETVYTVSIASTSGVFDSIAAVYPLAAHLEREASIRAAVIFIAR